MKSAIDVIMPTWNSAKSLDMTLVSLEMQSLQNFRLVVVDRRSTDDTVKKIEASKINSIVYQQTSSGIWPAMNEAVNNSQSPFLFFLNSDDLISPNSLRDILNYSTINELDACWLPTYSNGGFRKELKDSLSWRSVDHVYPGHSASFFVKRSVHEELGGYDVGLPDTADLCFFHKLTRRKYKLGVLPSDLGSFGVFTLGGYSYSSPYASKVVQEASFRCRNFHWNFLDFFHITVIFPIRLIWSVVRSKKKAFKRNSL